MSILSGTLLLLAAALTAWRVFRRLLFFLHMSQLHGYRVGPYAKWLATHVTSHVVRRSHIAAVVLLAALVMVPGKFAGVSLPLLLLGWSAAFVSARRFRIFDAKKPIAFTSRLKRLTLSASVISVLVATWSWLSFAGVDIQSLALRSLPGLLFADLFAPVAVAFAASVNAPIERAVHNHYKRSARRRLAARPDLKIVAVTGSYGKTSVKFAVAEVLGQRLNVLATPSSYNTPMGICKVINEQLNDSHQVLVLEMGARRQGDIRELCEIARPDVAIVTNVGVAHLETFGSIETTAREKGELVRQLSPDGTAILNDDDPRVKEMASGTTARILFAAMKQGSGAAVSADEIVYTADGARFRVHDRDRKDSAEMRTSLVGKHNVMNLLLAIAVGKAFGFRLRQMAPAIERLQPVEHRLQLRKQGPIVVIDDAFNSNPVGARNAVEVLGAFTGGRRIIVTPGMVELGQRQWDENLEFGQHIADNVDLAVLVGREQTRPIQEGLKAAAFPEENLHIFDSLKQAQEFLRGYLRAGDVVLYENDLPDQYEAIA